MIPTRLVRSRALAPSRTILASIHPPRPTLTLKTHRPFSSSPRRWNNAQNTPADKPSSEHKLTLQTPEPRLSLSFTCTVTDCGTRSTHEFSRRSYEKGIVIVQCPGCKNRHLIADHLGWFKDSTEDGRLRTVEDLVRAKGEKVRRGWKNAEGDVEYAPEE